MNLLYFLVFCAVVELNQGVANDIFHTNTFSIINGYDIIKIDICDNKIKLSCQLYGTLIKKDNKNSNSKMELSGHVVPGLVERLRNHTRNYSSLMNYIAYLGIGNEINYKSQTYNNTQNLIQAIRYVQWSIDVPIAALVEKLMANIDNHINKNGFFILLLKLFKINNGDLLFYCKFLSTNNCFDMYNGLNVDLVTRNIYYGPCVGEDNNNNNKSNNTNKNTTQDKPLKNLPRKWLYFCQTSDYLSTLLTKIHNALLIKFKGSSYLEDLIKSGKKIIDRYPTSYRLISDIFLKNNNNINEQIDSWNDTITFLTYFRMLINKFNINLLTITFRPNELSMSVPSSLSSISVSKINFNIQIFIQILCKNDASSCVLDNTSMNMYLDKDFVYYWPLRLKADQLNKSFNSLLKINGISNENIKFIKIFYNEKKYTKLNNNEKSMYYTNIVTQLPITTNLKQDINIHNNTSTVAIVDTKIIINVKWVFYSIILGIILLGCNIILIIICLIKCCRCCKKSKNLPILSNTHKSFESLDVNTEIKKLWQPNSINKTTTGTESNTYSNIQTCDSITPTTCIMPPQPKITTLTNVNQDISDLKDNLYAQIPSVLNKSISENNIDNDNNDYVTMKSKTPPNTPIKQTGMSKFYYSNRLSSEQNKDILQSLYLSPSQASTLKQQRPTSTIIKQTSPHLPPPPPKLRTFSMLSTPQMNTSSLPPLKFKTSNDNYYRQKLVRPLSIHSTQLDR